jgi:hypothetical protein
MFCPAFQTSHKITMRPTARISTAFYAAPFSSSVRVKRPVICCLHTSASKLAVAHPVTAHGPPPKTPLPAPAYGEHVERRKRQSEIIKQGKELRLQGSEPSSALKKRFWKDVHVKEVPGAATSPSPFSVGRETNKQPPRRAVNYYLLTALVLKRAIKSIWTLDPFVPQLKIS